MSLQWSKLATRKPRRGLGGGAGEICGKNRSAISVYMYFWICKYQFGSGGIKIDSSPISGQCVRLMLLISVCANKLELILNGALTTFWMEMKRKDAIDKVTMKVEEWFKKPVNFLVAAEHPTTNNPPPKLRPDISRWKWFRHHHLQWHEIARCTNTCDNGNENETNGLRSVPLHA